MTYSLVNAGAVASNAGGTSLTPACTSTTAHNLLVLVFSFSSSLATPSITLPAGWLSAPQVNAGTGTAVSQIFYYPDCPAGITSAAVTWGGLPNAACAGQILEFHDSAGTNTSPLDVTGSITSDVTTPVPVATASATTVAGGLAVCGFTGQYTSATKDTLVQGAGFTHGGNYGDAVKQSLHSGFDYNLNTGATGVQTDSVTFTGPFTVAAGSIATFAVYTAPVTGVTHLTSLVNAYPGSAQSVWTTASVSAGNGDVVFCFLEQNESTAISPPAVSSVAGLGNSAWNLGITRYAWDGVFRTATFYWTAISGAQSGAITITLASADTGAVMWSVVKATGYNTTTPFVAANLVTANATATSVTKAYTQAFGGSGHGLAFVTHHANETTTARSSPAWTALGESHGGPSIGVLTQWIAGTDTSCSGSWVTSATSTIIGLELAPAAGAAAGLLPQQLRQRRRVPRPYAQSSPAFR